MTHPGPSGDEGRLSLEAFWRDLPLPAYIVDRGRGFYMANPALARAFGYKDVETVEAALASGGFLAAHFNSETVGEFFELLVRHGRVDNWRLDGETLDGQALSLEVSAWGTIQGSKGLPYSVKAVFTPPGEVRGSTALLNKARLEAEQAEKAKNEFLANINHELRTPLNIIIGMLNLALEDETVSGDLRDNLSLARDGASRLFDILNDLIALSDLEGGRLTSDIIQFSPQMLLNSLTRKFEGSTRDRGVRLRQRNGDNLGVVLEGGYNFISLALEKLLYNAIKFADEGRGEAVIGAALEEKDDGLWLTCVIHDNGAGFPEDVLADRALFRQGDGSMIRKHGGLGLGLRLAGNLAAALGGSLGLANPPEGGAELSFSVPVKMAEEA